jgi:hypothetical protein
MADKIYMGNCCYSDRYTEGKAAPGVNPNLLKSQSKTLTGQRPVASPVKAPAEEENDQDEESTQEAELPLYIKRKYKVAISEGERLKSSRLKTTCVYYMGSKHMIVQTTYA